MELKDCKYLKVEARVRYWEDAMINNTEDEDGSLVPFRDGDLWQPTIHLESGAVMLWPQGTTAQIHYKVCDQGEYWLTDSRGNKKFKWNGYYVPDDLLCHNDQGFGDYIIFHVDEYGMIVDFHISELDPERWESVN